MDTPVSKKSFSARVRNIILASNRQPTRVESYRTTLMNLDDYLPQPEEDRKIASKVKQLYGLIDAHATYDFYHERPVKQEKEDVLELLQKRLFRSDEAAARGLAFNLHSAGSHRATFIRIVIARAIVKAIDFHGDPAISLLPQEILMFMTAFKNTPRLIENSQVDEVALCEWRRIGLYLLSGPESKTVQLQHTSYRIEMMLGSLDEILSPFAESDRGGAGNVKRLSNLRAIIQKATDIAVLLFGQPCGWQFDWTLRPVNEIEELIERPNGHHQPNSHNSQPAQQGSIVVSARTQSSLSDLQPRPPSPEKKRRRRLGRSHSTKAKDVPRQEPRKDKYPPMTPIRLPELKAGEEIDEGVLYRTTTGGTDAQHKGGDQRHYPHSHYNEYHGRPSMEERTQSYTQRSRSHPEFAPIYQQETIQHRNAHDKSNIRREPETSDSFSFKEGHEGVAPPAPLKDTQDDGLQQRPQTRSRQIEPQESFLDGPQQSRFKRETPVMIPSSRSSRPIICFPALLKVRDEYGCQLPEPLLVSEAVVDNSVLTAWY
ncbi:hypothetical protein BDZ45DRAFT_675090 [Acephala macrosclerotiorum]|nr:hypothetical protein BDZ45DRAFT_675090 [Acephala macrosclerotiorum]